MELKIILSAVVAFALTALSGPILIPMLKRLKFGQSIREEGPAWHKKKEGTPTMGGIMFIIPIAASTLLFGLLNQKTPDMRLWSALFMAIAYGMIGFIDDYIKVVKKRNLGLSARQKIILQVIVAVAFVASLQMQGALQTGIYLPFIGKTLELSYFYYLFAVVTIVGFVNGVNLTDGLDGLASSVSVPVAVFFMIASGILALTQEGILAGALCGGLLGFLIFNFHPAKVFMGDTGSLFIGGAVVALAFVLNIPVIIFIAGGIYLIEAFSVMLQVAYFKATHGKRLFKMSPLHHHFEKCGWGEVKIVVVFTLISAVLCALSVLGIVNYFVV